MDNLIEKMTEINNLVMVGTSHRLASVEIRELFSLEGDYIPLLYKKLLDMGMEEVVYLSTCNRVEFYLLSSFGDKTAGMVWEALHEFTGLAKRDFEDSIDIKYGLSSVRHLLEVSASLDSMVLGENEITGQLKNSFQVAKNNFATGAIFNKLFERALFTSKRVKRETKISKNPLSIASIAIDRAKSIFPDISEKTILLIGAGEMGELVLKYIMKESPQRLILANRTPARAEKICKNLGSDAEIVPLSELSSAMVESDIVLSSVRSSSYIINKKDVEDIMTSRGGKPIFFIDIAVPRNVDPLCKEIGGVDLYNVDSLKEIARNNMESRQAELKSAFKIVEEEVFSFQCWFEELKIAPLISSLSNKFDSIRKTEWEKYSRRKLKHLSEKDLELVNELTVQIMTKTLHNPIMNLKKRNSFSPCSESKEITVEVMKLIEDMFIR